LFNIENTLNELSQKRPIFRSEKDLQQGLFNWIQRDYKRCKKNIVTYGVKADLWLEDYNREIFIQLRHKTRKLSVNIDGSAFSLKTHGAQDQGRYDFFKDVQGLQYLCNNKLDKLGYSILLTNDHLYWEQPNKEDTVDKDFLLFDGRNATGKLAWTNEASHGTKSGREKQIELKQNYKLKWGNYSRFPIQDTEFRYLIVKV
jgi:hypothetical protein